MSQRILLSIVATAVISLVLIVSLHQTDPTSWRRLTISNPHLNSLLSASKGVNTTEEPQNISTPVEELPAHEPLDRRPLSTQPETTLVLATLSETDNSWVEAELGDLLGASSNLHTAIYVVDNDTAPLHTPANKGHEAMVYLTYIIDFYDHLPEVSIFMHGHPEAWHNNALLSMSSSEIVRNLDRSKVLRDGYFNLRCHWAPGCQPGLNPAATEQDENKLEELVIGDAWRVLFPLDSVPEMLAQPCCSQFAVTRAVIHANAVERYIELRDWLINTELSDYYTGRVFEYFWHWIFKRVTTFCPDPRICYCEGYGICFEDPQDYARFFELAEEVNVYKNELETLGELPDDKTVTRRDTARRDYGSRAEPDDQIYDETLALSDEIFKLRKKGMAEIAASVQAGRHSSNYGAAFPWSKARPWGKRKNTQPQIRSLSAATSQKARRVSYELGPSLAEVGKTVREEWLQSKINKVTAQLDELKAVALEAGKTLARKEAALAATRNHPATWDDAVLP